VYVCFVEEASLRYAERCNSASLQLLLFFLFFSVIFILIIIGGLLFRVGGCNG
jgi:hypothetical protein